MKKLLPCLLLYACTQKPAVQQTPAPVNNIVATAPAPAPPPSDTVFLRRSPEAGYYEAVFIDPAASSAARRTLMNFEFRETYKADFENGIKTFPENYKKKKTLGLPEKWLPLCLYNNEYFLYAPSDWGNAGRRMILPEAYVVWNMEGPTPFYWHAIRQTGKRQYELRYQGYNDARKINIHILDPKTQRAVFEYVDGAGTYYQLYTPVSQANQYRIIVNYSPSRKAIEYDFQDPDWKQLLQKN